MVRETKTEAEFNELYGMLEEYFQELHGIDGHVRIQTPEMIRNEYVKNIFTDFYLITENGKTAGFVITGSGENCHPCAQMYIEALYVKPAFRRKGTGTEAVREILKDTNSICMYVLKKNTVAKKFWDKYTKDWTDWAKMYPKPPLENHLDWHIYIE